MAITSYNENSSQQIKLRHLFWPGSYGIISESIIAIVALIVFNISWLSDRLLAPNTVNGEPFAVWSQLLKRFLDNIGKPHLVQQFILFALWAVAGMLIYILVFRGIQLFFGVERSVNQGIRYVRRDRSQGLVLWLESLHDFFMKAVVVILAGLALAIGAILCFGIASQELNNGLSTSLPTNLVHIATSLGAALLSVRLVMVGACLLSRHFRNWYLY